MIANYTTTVYGCFAISLLTATSLTVPASATDTAPATVSTDEQLSTEPVRYEDVARAYATISSNFTEAESRLQDLASQLEAHGREIQANSDWPNRKALQERQAGEAAQLKAGANFLAVAASYFDLQISLAQNAYGTLDSTLAQLESRGPNADPFESRALFNRTVEHFDRQQKTLERVHAALRRNPTPELRREFDVLTQRMNTLKTRLERMDKIQDQASQGGSYSAAVGMVKASLGDLRGTLAELESNREFIDYYVQLMKAKAATTMGRMSPFGNWESSPFSFETGPMKTGVESIEALLFQSDSAAAVGGAAAKASAPVPELPKYRTFKKR